MPFIDIRVIEGAFSPEEKREMVERVSEAVVAVEGEPLRPSTHTVITETPSGEWAIGGQPFSAEDIRAKRGV
ncbi:MAG TPA: tautomerase family protein [Solirubrobacterales bacterium]|nr:tautomerase family protein [Solirubrobacterales bacterium]